MQQENADGAAADAVDAVQGRRARDSAESNALRPVRRRARAKESRAADSHGAAENSSASAAAQKAERAANRATTRQAPAPARSAPEHPASEKRRRSPASRELPEDVRQRFVQVGRAFYFPDGARAFTDRGRRLTTGSENTEVIRSLVEIATARHWDRVAVSGTERFRREAWLAARRAGLDVQGYTPTRFEQSRLIKTATRPEAVTHDKAPSPLRRAAAGSRGGAEAGRADRAERLGGVIAGTLIDHGPARYRHDPQAAQSYFVRLETAGGEREVWGVDLERALRESLTKPQPGDEIGVRAVRREPVTVRTATRDTQGVVIAEQRVAAHRNRWIVEKSELLRERAAAARVLRDPAVTARQAVKQHPELAGTYLQVHAAELAARRLRDAADQQVFVARVREALAQVVARGEPLPPVRLRERASPQRAPVSQVSERPRGRIRE